MPTSPQNTYTNASVRPLIHPDEAYATMVAVNLPASIHYPAGSILGELAASHGTAAIRPANGGVAVATPGAVTVAAAAGSTAYAAGVYLVGLTWIDPKGESVLGATAPVTLVATNQVNVTGVPAFPAGVTAANVYISGGPGDETVLFVQQIATNANFSITTVPAAGAARPPTTGTATTTSDGSEIAKYILPYEVATDSATPPNITLGSSAGAAPFGYTQLSVDVFTRGSFNPADLVQSGAGQIDASGLAQLNGHIVYGDLTGGRIDVG